MSAGTINNIYGKQLAVAKEAFLNKDIKGLQVVESSLGDFLSSSDYSDKTIPNPILISEFIDEAISFLQEGAPVFSENGKVTYNANYPQDDMNDFIHRWGNFSWSSPR